MLAKTEKERQICTMQYSESCKKREGNWLLKDFYTAINDKFFANGRVHICKECIKNYCYKEDGSVDLDKFKQILMMINAPFYSKEFNTAIEKDKDTIGVYMRAICLNYKGQEWRDGETQKYISNQNKDKEPFVISPELIRKWGGSFEEEEYIFLEEELKEWKKTHKCDNQAEITLLKEICITVLDIRNARNDSNSTKNLRKDLQDLMKTASVDPAKANAISDSQTVDRFGVWIKDIEQKRPAEWHDEQEKYVDMDGFKPYIQDYIVRPIKNFFTGSKDFIVNGKDLSFKKDT